MDALPDSGSMQKLALLRIRNLAFKVPQVVPGLILFPQVETREWKQGTGQKWKQGTGQISPGNRRLEFGDGRNWEAAFSARSTSRGLRTGRRAIGSHSNRLSANKFRLEAWISVLEETASSGRQPSTRASGCVETQPTQSSYLAPKLGRAANEVDSSRTEHLGRTD